MTGGVDGPSEALSDKAQNDLRTSRRVVLQRREASVDLTTHCHATRRRVCWPLARFVKIGMPGKMVC